MAYIAVLSYVKYILISQLIRYVENIYRYTQLCLHFAAVVKSIDLSHSCESLGLS